MGLRDLFASKPNYEGRPHELWSGTQIPITDVDPAFINHGRTCDKLPRYGHAVPVRLYAANNEILVIHNGQPVAKMQPDSVSAYYDDLRTIQRRGEIGTCNAYIKPKSSKAPHALGLNWGRHSIDGGIL